MFAIIPITLSAKHTLKHLLDDPKEIENMFWYVFGTFTNCFTFIGKGSWTGASMNSTRLFVGKIIWSYAIFSVNYTYNFSSKSTKKKYPSVLNF